MRTQFKKYSLMALLGLLSLALEACSSVGSSPKSEALPRAACKKAQPVPVPEKAVLVSQAPKVTASVNPDLYHPELKVPPILSLFKVYGVRSDKLEVRLGPGKQHPLLYVLRKNTRVQILAKRGDWVEIGTSQWVLGKHLH